MFIKIKKYLKLVIILLLIYLLYKIIITNINIIKKANQTNIEANISLTEEVLTKNNIEKNRKQNTIKPVMPETIKGHTILGEIIIDKINLKTYILDKTTDETLNLGVTKFYGIGINKLGNFCIAGHNYNNTTMFADLKKLEINDEFELRDIYGQSIKYKIYKIDKVYANELECLEYENEGEREVTLITCTTAAIKRLIIKAVEIYD